VGSSASTAFPCTLLTAAVADGIAETTARLKAKTAGGKGLDAAILETVRELATETKSIRFEGNNYSEEWVREAEKRGLPNLKKTPEALKQIVSPQSKKLLTELGVFSEAEIESRYHVRVERYVKVLSIEVEALLQMVDTMIVPAGSRYHAELAGGVAAAKQAGLVHVPQMEVAERVGSLLQSLLQKKKNLAELAAKVEQLPSEDEKAEMLAHDVSRAMVDVRNVCDELEGLVADELWPLPKYREMLFLS
jgi:glutamine synthetase